MGGSPQRMTRKRETHPKNPPGKRKRTLDSSVQDAPSAGILNTAQHALQESQRTLNTLMSNLPGMVYRCRHDRDWTLEFASEGCLSLTGYALDDLIGNKKISFAQLIHTDDIESVIRGIDEGVREKKPFQLIYRIRTATGEEKWLWEQGRGVFSPSGELLALEGFITDITERKRTEDKLAESLSLLRATLESTADGILVVDLKGSIVSFNQKFVQMWRIPQEIIDSRSDDKALGFVLGQLKDPHAFLAKVRELYSQPDIESYDVLEFKDGRIFERYSQPRKTGEKSVGRVWSFRDVTERTKSEEQLRHSQKMEAVGRLAGGVAHDFNNLLTAILGHADLLLERLEPGNPLRRSVEEIQKAATRSAELTRQLLAFSRKQVVSPHVLELNALVSHLRGILSRVIGEDTELVIVSGGDTGRVKADPGQIEQMIMNLAINARDAMPKGGRLTIETGRAELEESFARGMDGVTPGSYATLSVTDNGCGMDAETKAHLFEPFFTTKEQEKGTGLGLSTVFGIVKQNGGLITVASELGEGTTFTIHLPHTEESPAHTVTPGIPIPTPRGIETVLLVEDEEMVRSLAREVLQRNGYTVLEAGDAAEAIHIADTRKGPIDLLLTDVVMSRMNGRELAENLASRRPRMKVLLMSGYTDDAGVRRGISEEGVPFLEKPFSADHLVRRVREVLDGP